jgi:glycosyltransferase
MKVSIITVCFNAAGTIEDTISSVLGQDYNDIEYIIIDGGSTDGTLDIIDRYRGKISKFISEPDNGVYDAMNKGLKLAIGDAIGFLNSDDFYVDKTVIRRIAEMMIATNADCCYGNLEYVDRNNINKTIRKWRSRPYYDGLFEKGWHPPHPTFFVKKSVFDKYGGFDLACDIGADYELMLRFLKRYGITSCYIPDVLVKMRIGGKSNRTLWQIIKANIECYQAWKKNGLKITPLIILKKPVSKLIQYVKCD